MFRAYGVTERGRIRPTNEDCFGIFPELQLCIVADGMGGHSAGEVAARLAVDAMADYAAEAPNAADAGSHDGSRSGFHDEYGVSRWPFGFDPSLSDARMLEVLAELGLDDWLRRLPNGLNTVLASHNSGMSAGEAQLLAFARVFVRDPGLIILDEASSRLDPATERRLERAIDTLLEDRTGDISSQGRQGALGAGIR